MLTALAIAAAASGAARPAAPTIAGPDATTPGKHTYVFSSLEKGVKQSRLRFRCSLDSATLHACRARTTFTLAGGAHVLRAQAVDPAGHKSAVSRLRIVVQDVAPALSSTTLWQKATTTAKVGMGAEFGIALGPDGNVYVSNVGDDRVQVYDPSGNVVRKFGSRGTGPGQFRFEFNPDPADASIPFSGISVDSGTGAIYVDEAQRVQKFDAQGNYLLGWGKVGIDQTVRADRRHHGRAERNRLRAGGPADPPRPRPGVRRKRQLLDHVRTRPDRRLGRNRPGRAG